MLQISLIEFFFIKMAELMAEMCSSMKIIYTITLLIKFLCEIPNVYLLAVNFIGLGICKYGFKVIKTVDKVAEWLVLLPHNNKARVDCMGLSVWSLFPSPCVDGFPPGALVSPVNQKINRFILRPVTLITILTYCSGNYCTQYFWP